MQGFTGEGILSSSSTFYNTMGNSESRVHHLREQHYNKENHSVISTAAGDTPTTSTNTKKRPKFLSLPSSWTRSRSVSPPFTKTKKPTCKTKDIPVILNDLDSPQSHVDPFECHDRPHHVPQSPLSLERQRQERCSAIHLRLPDDDYNGCHHHCPSRSSSRSNLSDSTGLNSTIRSSSPSTTKSNHSPSISGTFRHSSPESPSMRQRKHSSHDVPAITKRLSQMTQHSTFSKTMGAGYGQHEDTEEEDTEKDHPPGFHLANDLWYLRGLNQLSEMIRDKHRRTHFFLKRVWKGNYLAPLENPSLVIHWASAPGSWCLEMALEHPTTTVAGVDQIEQSKLIFTSVDNLNLSQVPLFEPDCGMASFDSNSADLIVVRDDFIYLVPKPQWIQLLAQFHRVLKPGGYLEIYTQDYSVNVSDHYGKTMDGWIRHLFEHAGSSQDFYGDITEICDQLGFGKRDYRQVDLPIGDWPTSLSMKEIGYLAKIITFKRWKILKYWILALEQDVTEEEYTETIQRAMDACEREKHHFVSCYFGAQKRPLE